MNKFRIAVLFVLILLLCMVTAVGAQDDALTMSMRRDFGYSSGGGDIQGLFSITAKGPADLSKVTFYIDKTVIGEVLQPPFKFQFNTDNYPLGRHELYVIGITADGRSLQSQIYHANFVSAGEGWQAALKIAGPILGISLLAVLLATVVPILTGRSTMGFPAGGGLSYPLGGTICPKCQRPFALHIYGMNLLTHKLDRCPYCGKWSMVRRVPIVLLRTAEEAELARQNEQAQVPGMSEAEKLKKELDESKYHEI